VFLSVLSRAQQQFGVLAKRIKDVAYSRRSLKHMEFIKPLAGTHEKSRTVLLLWKQSSHAGGGTRTGGSGEEKTPLAHSSSLKEKSTANRVEPQRGRIGTEERNERPSPDLSTWEGQVPGPIAYS